MDKEAQRWNKERRTDEWIVTERMAVKNRKSEAGGMKETMNEERHEWKIWMD